MAKKTDKKTRVKSETEPKFPYTTKPGSLRKMLQQIPQKPVPPKFDKSLLKAWGFSDANDYSMLRVLKSVELLNEKNEPTELYSQFMNLKTGAGALSDPIKRIYEPLFHASHKPFNESPETLHNLFNIHSGGSSRTIEQQIQTFKALCEYTDFDSVTTSINTTEQLTSQSPGIPTISRGQAGNNPSININLHIHLPENKSSRDYEAMIEDIGRYIFGVNKSDPKDE